MSNAKTFAVVGGGLAGERAAETLRAGFDGNIVLICAEPEPPYERPPLSKEYLRGEKPTGKVFLRPVEFYEERRIELILEHRAEHIAVSSKLISLDDGRKIAYDKALIATGATPRRLNVPGANLKGVAVLRTIRDADALAEHLAGRPHVLVVGAGFIGCEVAASARALRCEVTMISHALPLARALGSRIGEFYAQVHREHGVDVRVGVEIAEFRGSSRVESAVTTTGEQIACDLVVIGIGVTPNVSPLNGEPVTIENGVVTDEYCRTGAPDLFAAGDVANWWHPQLKRRMHIEHFDNAQNQGIAAAKTMLGAGEPYAPVPYFWSDQYDINLQYAGYRTAADREIVRGDPQSRSFSIFSVGATGRLSGCVALNRFKDLTAARTLLRTMAHVTPEDLADESVDLKRLAAS